MKVIGLLSYYNGMPPLTLTVPWNMKWFDELWAFDGAYKTFQQGVKPFKSDDGSTEFLESQGAILHDVEQFPTQLAKRNFICDFAAKNLEKEDYLFYIDSDELLMGNPEFWKLFLKNNTPKIVSFPILNILNKIQQFQYPRCFRNTDQYFFVEMRFGVQSKQFGNLNMGSWVNYNLSMILNLKQLYAPEYQELAQDFYERRRVYWSRGGNA